MHFVVKQTFIQYFEIKVEADNPLQASAAATDLMAQADSIGEAMMPKKTDFQSVVVPAELAFEE